MIDKIDVFDGNPVEVEKLCNNKAQGCFGRATIEVKYTTLGV